MKNLSQDIRSPDGDLNPVPPEHEAGVLTTAYYEELKLLAFFILGPGEGH